MEEAELRAKMLELLKTDEEFRLAVAGLLGLDEVLRAIRSLQEQVAENTTATRALQEQVADNSKAIRELRKDMIEGFRRHDEELAKLRADMHEGFELLRRHIDALGARWGLLVEEAFRKGMKGVVERYFGEQVERWTYRDEEGFVFGRPSEVEADLLITDREHILMEIKSSVSRADVFELWRIGQLYERVVGVRPRLAVVSPFVREEAKKVAEELGIEVYTSL